MSVNPNSLLGLLHALIDVLEDSHLDYAIGGALAYSAWAEPRATQDIDVNVWLAPQELSPLTAALAGLGATFDADNIAQAAYEQGMFVARVDGYRIDIFVPSVPYYDVARTARRRVRFLDRDCWILAPESLAVFKMMFHRPKDLVDLARMLAIQGATFDTTHVRVALTEMLGDKDERIDEWDRLVQANVEH